MPRLRVTVPGAAALLLIALAAACLVRPLAALLAVAHGARLVVGAEERVREGVAASPLRWIEAGEGRPVVLLHGLRGEAGVWLSLQRSLAGRGWRVLAPDLPGYGDSGGPPAPARLDPLVDGIGDWMAQIAGEPPAVVGNSMGGWLALRLALARPEAVRALVLVDAAGIVFEPPPGHLLVARRPRDAREAFGLLFHRPPPAAGLAARALSRRDPRTSLDLLADMRSGRSRLDDLLAAVGPPTLVVWGRSDGVIPLHVGEALAGGIPGARLEILEGAGHMPQLESPRRLAEAIDRFLRTLPAP